MRILTLLFLIALIACKSKNPVSSGEGPSTTQDTTSAKSYPSPYVFTDTILVSLAPKDFYAVTKIKPNMPILDLRPESAYKIGHIWRSVNMDPDAKDFDRRLAGFGRTQEYAVYCQNGEHSFKVAEQMKKMGFKRIYHLQKGLTNWGDTGQALQLK